VLSAIYALNGIIFKNADAASSNFCNALLGDESGTSQARPGREAPLDVGPRHRSLEN